MQKISLFDLFCTLSVEEQSELIDASVAYARTVAEPYTSKFRVERSKKLVALMKAKFSQFFA